MRRTMQKTTPCRGGEPGGINLWPMQALMNLRTESQDRILRQKPPLPCRFAPGLTLELCHSISILIGYKRLRYYVINKYWKLATVVAHSRCSGYGSFSISSHSPSNCIHSRHPPPRSMHISRMIKKISQVTTIKHTGVQHSATTSIRTTKQIV